MHFTAAKNELNALTQICLRAVSAHNPMPVLSCLLFEARDNQVILTATDLEWAVRGSMPAETIIEGSAAIPGKYITGMLTRLPDISIDVITDISTNNTSFGYHNSEMTLHGYPTEEFPKFPDLPEQPALKVSQNIFKAMLKKVLFAVAYDEHRPMFNGINIKLSEETVLFMVATDTRKLAVCEEKLIQPAGELINVIVPGKALNELYRILEPVDDEFNIYVTDSKIFFEINNICLMSRLIAGTYPDYRIVVPNQFLCEVRASVSALIDASERALSLVSAKRHVFNIKFQPGALLVYFNSEAGRIREEIEVDFSGESLDVGFNIRFFIDLLKAADTEEIIIKLSGFKNPAVFKPVDGENYFSILVPSIT
ncbi:MAG: DNA polymerase III subunit beta [Firmicutes bacterium]|nr:DNA polymerase III subunit beta [Bacillota bacterium]